MSMRRKLFAAVGLAVVGVGVGVGTVLAQREYKSGVVWPEPALVTPAPLDKPGAPPSDAVVLFDGTNLDKWQNGNKWEVKDGVATVKGGDITTKDTFGDCQLHVEFATPDVVKGSGQGRGNSGLFLMNRYELQVLDSVDNKTYFDGQCASIYKQSPPMVNVCRKPGEWQTYDVLFTAPKFGEGNTVTTPAYMTVFHNGVCVHNHFPLTGNTNYDRPAAYARHADKMPIRLQNHGNPVKYRNIWIREIKQLVGTPPAPKTETEPKKEKK